MSTGEGVARDGHPEAALNWRERLASSPHHCPTPIDQGFYATLRGRLDDVPVQEAVVLEDFRGEAVPVSAGSGLTLKLLDKAQIVNLFAFNRLDPDERIWMQSLVREGLFLKRYSRLWGTMARCRPLLTVLEDTVTTRPTSVPFAQHHPIFGGSGTPADWKAVGGAPSVPSTWQQLASLMASLQLPASLLKENVSIFEKGAFDGPSQRLLMLPSDAVAGDFVTFFAEIDLYVLVVLSPYGDGSFLSDTRHPEPPAPVEISLQPQLAAPLPWPYPGVPYPDISSYLDSNGERSREGRKLSVHQYSGKTSI